ncbi:MAG: hypothetical protein AB7E80_12085 [Hyphomicrobiaceae bacterium]
MAILLLTDRPALAVAIDVEPQPVLRRVLGLYDGKAEGPSHESRLHRFVEMPLNQLGYDLVLRDVNAPLPAPEALSEFRGVVTWFLEPVQQAGALGTWLTQALARQDLHYVVLGEVLPGADDRLSPLTDKLYAKLGLADTHDLVSLGVAARPVAVDAEMIGFERPLDKVLPEFPVLAPVSERTRVHLSLSVPLARPGDTSSVVVTGPRGGYVADGFALYFEPTADRLTWIVNPFAFFRAALGSEIFPIPDVTTASGRRIYFSHIDGDGWNNFSEIERFKAEGLASSEVILREAIVPYPDLPVSVALIGCDIEPAMGGSADAARIARAMFALPQVEVASHTHSHPYDWKFFERYDRVAEEAMIEQHARPEQTVRERMSEVVFSLAGKPVPVTSSNKYVAGTDDLPRTFLRNPFDLGVEVAGSLKKAESLAPPGKRARLYQWSGDTTPFEAAVRATRLAGVANINGGDSRLDREFPSVAYVPPISRRVGHERQIYAANSNENTYTNDWTGPYYGFFMLEETLRNTDAPRRLKPFNLYYHMYSGEKPAALAAVRHFLEMARRGDVIPTDASHYAAIADDFFDVAIVRMAERTWSVTHRGALQTLRMDGAEAMEVDRTASIGVIGARRHQGSLYIAMDSAVEQAVVSLKDRPGAGGPVRPVVIPPAGGSAPAAEAAQQAAPFLVDARWRLNAVTPAGCGLIAQANGYGPGAFRFSAEPDRAFTVRLSRSGVELAQETAHSTADGTLTFVIDADAIEPVEMRLECHG